MTKQSTNQLRVQLRVQLIVANGRSAGQVIPIRGPRFFIGRAEDCHLRPHGDMASRYHCAIIVDDASVVIRELGSKNGTFVNGHRLTHEQFLRDGDRLTVGNLEFEVKLGVQTTENGASPLEEDSDMPASDTAETCAASEETEGLPAREDKRPPHVSPHAVTHAVTHAANNSCDAAAEALRKFFKGR